MIALLTGKIAQKTPDHLIVDVQGVGYRVMIPFSTYYELPEAGEVTLHIHTCVREDAILLYGFRTLPEKAFFSYLSLFPESDRNWPGISSLIFSRRSWRLPWHRAICTSCPPFPVSAGRPLSGWCWSCVKKPASLTWERHLLRKRWAGVFLPKRCLMM